MWNSDVPHNGAAIELSLSGQEQPPSFCVLGLSSSAVRSDGDLASFGNDSIIGSSTVLPASCNYMHHLLKFTIKI